MKIKKSEELYHVPDLIFAKFCENEFSINKGIYNTIDKWFYDKGIKSIIIRRKKMIDFFYYIQATDEAKGIKFGNGGLTSRLTQFWDESENSIIHVDSNFKYLKIVNIE